MRNGQLIIGGTLVVTFIALSLFGAISPFTFQINLDLRLLPPSGPFLLGSDENGSSIALQLVRACYLSVSLSILVAISSAAIGIAIGSISGYFGGRIDEFLMRGIEIIQAFPNFLLALCLIAALGPSFFNLLLAMTTTTWIGFARLVRTETIHLRALSFVEASRGFGSSTHWQIVRHILPQQTGLLMVHVSHTIAGVVIAEAGLSFLGLGLPADVPSWGQLINRGRPFLEEAPHISLLPSMMLSLFVLSFYLLGDGIQKSLNSNRF